MFEAIGNAGEKGVDSGKKYLESTIEYTKLKVFKQLALTSQMLSKILLVGVFLIFGLIFLGVSCALALGDLFNSLIFGFLATSAIFFIIGVLLYIFRKYYFTLIFNKLSIIFYKIKQVDDEVQ